MLRASLPTDVRERVDSALSNRAANLFDLLEHCLIPAFPGLEMGQKAIIASVRWSLSGWELAHLPESIPGLGSEVPEAGDELVERALGVIRCSRQGVGVQGVPGLPAGESQRDGQAPEAIDVSQKAQKFENAFAERLIRGVRLSFEESRLQLLETSAGFEVLHDEPPKRDGIFPHRSGALPPQDELIAGLLGKNPASHGLGQGGDEGAAFRGFPRKEKHRPSPRAQLGQSLFESSRQRIIGPSAASDDEIPRSRWRRFGGVGVPTARAALRESRGGDSDEEDIHPGLGELQDEGGEQELWGSVRLPFAHDAGSRIRYQESRRIGVSPAATIVSRRPSAAAEQWTEPAWETTFSSIIVPPMSSQPQRRAS